MSKADFEQLLFKFKSEMNPLTQAPIDVTFTALDFMKVTGEAANGLFKLAALEKIYASEDDVAT